MIEARQQTLDDIIDGEHDVESDPKQDRYNYYGVGDHYAFPLFLVEFGVLGFQARHQQTQNDNVSDEEEDEDQ